MTEIIINGFHGSLHYERACEDEKGYESHGCPFWTFSIGGHDLNQNKAIKDAKDWLDAQGFDPSHYILIRHRHSYGPNYAWLDVFDKDTAMRIRLMTNARSWDVDNPDHYYAASWSP
jgi:hypothetical protein